MRTKTDCHFEVVKMLNGEWLLCLVGKNGEFRNLRISKRMGELAHLCRLGGFFDVSFDEVIRLTHRVWAK